MQLSKYLQLEIWQVIFLYLGKFSLIVSEKTKITFAKIFVLFTSTIKDFSAMCEVHLLPLTVLADGPFLQHLAFI